MVEDDGGKIVGIVTLNEFAHIDRERAGVHLELPAVLGGPPKGRVPIAKRG